MSLRSVRSVLAGTLKQIGGRGRGRDLMLGYRLAKVWREAMGELMATHCHVVHVTDNVLTVGVTSAVWLAEAEHFQDRILDNLEQALGSRHIKTVRFIMLAQAPVAPGPVRPSSPSAPEVPEARLLPDQEKDLTHELDRIADPLLRAQMRRVLLKSLSRNGQ